MSVQEETKLCSFCPKPTKYCDEHCPKCGCKDHEIINFDRMWGEGDVVCVKCGAKVRSFDSG